MLETVWQHCVRRALVQLIWSLFPAPSISFLFLPPSFSLSFIPFFLKLSRWTHPILAHLVHRSPRPPQLAHLALLGRVLVAVGRERHAGLFALVGDGIEARAQVVVWDPQCRAPGKSNRSRRARHTKLPRWRSIGDELPSMVALPDIGEASCAGVGVAKRCSLSKIGGAAWKRRRTKPPWLALEQEKAFRRFRVWPGRKKFMERDPLFTCPDGQSRLLILPLSASFFPALSIDTPSSFPLCLGVHIGQ